MNTNERRGSKFDRSLSTTKIAALVRSDIAAAIKSNALPVGLKVSVRSASFSGGSAIRLTVTALPAGFVILNPERLALDIAEPGRFVPECHFPRYTAEASALLATVSAFAAAYNRDNSDIGSDHFDVHFYDGRASFATDLEIAERATAERAAQWFALACSGVAA